MTSSSLRTIQLVSLEGNIGAGKSTLLSALEKRLSIPGNKWVFLREPVHIWEKIRDSSGATILSKFYADPQKYSFAFQIMAFTTRLHELRRIIRENPDCCGIICERSLEADKHIFAKMLHDDGTMEDVFYEIYDTYFGEYEAAFRLDAVIYVDADPEICFDRIQQRSREGESVIPLGYLQKCKLYHQNWLLQDKIEQRMLHLNTNSVATFDENDKEDIGNQWLNQIAEFLEN